MRHLRIAGQVQQPVEQHRPVPGRQHEAVAVRPVRRARRRTSGASRTAPSPRRPCPSAGPDARSSPSAPRPSPAPAAPPPSSSGRGGAGGARGCSPGRAFPARGRRLGSEGAGTAALIPARPDGQGGFAGRRRPRPPALARRVRSPAAAARDRLHSPRGCLKRGRPVRKRRDESDHPARSPARGGAGSPPLRPRRPRRRRRAAARRAALRDRIAALESEKAELADELDRLRVKRDKDVAALDDLIAQLKPLIEEV